MKRFLVFSLLLIVCSFYVNAQKSRSSGVNQRKTKLSISKIIVYGSIEDRSFTKIPEILSYGFLNKPNMKFEIPDIKVSQNGDHYELINSSFSKNSDYLISGSISYKEDISFLFEISRPFIQSTTIYLDPISVHRENLLSGCTRLVDLIYAEINKVESVRSSSKLKYGIVAEHTDSGLYKLKEPLIFNLLNKFSQNSGLNKKARLIPWDSTRKYSFMNMEPARILDEIEADILIQARFKMDLNYIIVKPNLYAKNFHKEISLNQIKIDPKLLDFGLYQNDFMDLLDFLVPDDRLKVQRLEFLDSVQRFDLETSFRIAKQYIDFVGMDSLQRFKSLFLTYHGIELSQEDHRGYELLARIRENQKRIPEAIENWEMVIRYDRDKSKRAYYYTKKGVLFNLQQKYNEALNEFRFAYKSDPNFSHPDLGEINFLMGVDFARTSSLDNAVKYLRKSLEIDRTNLENHFWLGYAHYFKREYTKAIVYFKYLDVNSKAYPQIKQYVADCYYEESRKYFLKLKYDSAVYWAKESINYNDNENSNALLLKAYNRLDRFPDARQLVVSKLRANVFKPDILKSQGQDFRILFYSRYAGGTRYTLQEKYGIESIHYFKEYLKRKPSDSVSLYEVGNVYGSLNRNDSAVFFLEDALSKKYSNMSLYLDLAEVYIESNNPSKVIPLLDSSPPSNLNTSVGEKNHVIKLYLTVIAKVILKQDYVAAFNQLNTYFENKDKVVRWEFNTLKKWLANSNLEPDDRAFISSLTKKMESISY